MRAGFARIDITPRIGVEMYGFGPYLNRHSVGVRAPLEARTGVFEDGGRFACLITCDLGAVNEETVAETRRLVAEAFPGLEIGVLVCASHTHSAPAGWEIEGWGHPDWPYWNLLPARLCASVRSAMEALEEVRLSFGEAECRHLGLNRVFDRDAPPLEEVLREDWTPAMPEKTDTVCRVVRMDNPKGELKGFAAYFGCHPVVCSADNHYLHGDWPGVAMEMLMAENPGAVGLFLQGAHGDVNSGCVHKPERESLAALDVFARRFADSVRRALAAARPMADQSLSRAFLDREFTSRETITREMLLKMREEKSACFKDLSHRDDDFEARLNTVFVRGLDTLLAKLDRGETSLRTVCSGLRLGDVRILGAPFEIMQGIKNETAARVTAGIPLVVSLCNGSHGYAPSREVVRHLSEAGGGGFYEIEQVPLMEGYLPYADIHGELCEALVKLAEQLD